MSDAVAVGIVIIFLFVLLLGGAWVFVALGMAGVLGLWLAGVHLAGAVSLQMWFTSSGFLLTAAPLFIFTGEIMLRSGMSSSLYNGVSTWVGRFPGGLIHSNIAGCAMFAAISGSSGATAATLGIVAIPDQAARGYDKNLVAASLAASGTLGTLIPPSLNMIIYAAWMGCSLAQLFMAGLIPGIVLAIMFSIYIAIKCSLQPGLAPRIVSSWRSRMRSIKDLWPSLVLILFIFTAIYTGFVTPTETAAVSATIALVLAFVLGKFSFKLVYDSAHSALILTTMILLIVVGAKMFVLSLFYLKVLGALPLFIQSLNLPPLIVLIIIYIIYIILGMFLDSISLLVATLAFVQPIVVAMGIDLIWFGIVVVILTEIGLITPPVGLNLYIIMGIGNIPILDISKAVVPYFFMLLLAIAVLSVFPEVALWLPSTMG